jgi:flavodoxin
MLIAILLACLCAGSCTHAPVGEPTALKTNSGSDETGRPRVLILYQSKYGSTRQYADWIHKDIPSEIVDVEKGDTPEFHKYDVIVFGGSVRMGRVVIAPLIVETWNAVKEKKVVLFTTSGTPPQHPNILKIFNSSFPEDIRKEIQYFPLRGRILSKDIGFFDTFLIAIGRMVEKDEALRKFMSEDFDEVKPENLSPVLEYLKALLLKK